MTCIFHYFFFYFFLFLDNYLDAANTSVPVVSISSESQSDVSQVASPPELEVFDFDVRNNLEVPDSGKKKKVRSSSLTRFFSRGKQRKLEFAPVVRGMLQKVKSCNH